MDLARSYFTAIRLMLHLVLTNRYQIAFRMGHTEFGIPFLLIFPHSQRFMYEMISERCKSKPYTVLWENNFFAPNFPKMDSVGKISLLPKSHLSLS